MKFSENVIEISKSFMDKQKHVKLNYKKIEQTSSLMKESGITPFPSQIDTKLKNQTILMELLGDAINYCYWYGRHDIRPGNASSGKMYELVESSFNEEFIFPRLSQCIKRLSQLLSKNRFPLLEERIKHLEEFNNHVFTQSFIHRVSLFGEENRSCENLFELLIENFPGYGSDIFLKRASLFFLQLYRKFGWFKDDMYILHVPADYQVPKILNHLGCIEYSDSLRWKIQNHELIPKGSLEECEIRAATVLVCEELKALTDWNISDVDGWLWLRRKETNSPFHLTITTDY